MQRNIDTTRRLKSENGKLLGILFGLITMN